MRLLNLSKSSTAATTAVTSPRQVAASISKPTTFTDKQLSPTSTTLPIEESRDDDNKSYYGDDASYTESEVASSYYYRDESSRATSNWNLSSRSSMDYSRESSYVSTDFSCSGILMNDNEGNEVSPRDSPQKSHAEFGQEVELDSVVNGFGLDTISENDTIKGGKTRGPSFGMFMRSKKGKKSRSSPFRRQSRKQKAAFASRTPTSLPAVLERDETKAAPTNGSSEQPTGLDACRYPMAPKLMSPVKKQQLGKKESPSPMVAQLDSNQNLRTRSMSSRAKAGERINTAISSSASERHYRSQSLSKLSYMSSKLTPSKSGTSNTAASKLGLSRSRSCRKYDTVPVLKSKSRSASKPTKPALLSPNANDNAPLQADLSIESWSAIQKKKAKDYSNDSSARNKIAACGLTAGAFASALCHGNPQDLDEDKEDFIHRSDTICSSDTTLFSEETSLGETLNIAEELVDVTYDNLWRCFNNCEAFKTDEVADYIFPLPEKHRAIKQDKVKQAEDEIVTISEGEDESMDLKSLVMQGASGVRSVVNDPNDNDYDVNSLVGEENEDDIDESRRTEERDSSTIKKKKGIMSLFSKKKIRADSVDKELGDMMGDDFMADVFNQMQLEDAQDRAAVARDLVEAGGEIIEIDSDEIELPSDFSDLLLNAIAEEAVKQCLEDDEETNDIGTSLEL
ncbi:predicted protein [Thalassiosira pseudonana CCMP1335]|uniref:Uncharacterized protein n=1 Tax=Thalassiosira pseudonana TaxID=35128 RepID=B8BUB1_THAPS|nr:predicted protein [Thalassiosira pseudonana CCMP1335]EED94729.1 predicted protein [Thalassiosira pseudonana CCMP1335]